MKKRIISLLLAVCLCATLLPTTALAADPVAVGPIPEVYKPNVIYGKEPVVFWAETWHVRAALKSDNSLWTWGYNYNGAIGNGNGFYGYYDPKQNREIWAFVDTPYQTLDHVKTYEGGTWAIKEDNSLWVWGETAVRLGLSDNASTSVPQKYMDNVLSFSYGWSPSKPYESYEETLKRAFPEYNMYVVKTDGSLWAWGKNRYGELGDGTTQERTAPVKIMDGARYVLYAQGDGPGGTPYPGYGHVFVIKEDDSLWGWGADAVLMDNARFNDGVFTTTPEKHLDHVNSICSGDGTVAAITPNGSLYLWGTLPGPMEGAVSHWAFNTNHFRDFNLVAENVREVRVYGLLRIVYVTTSDEVYIWGNDHNGDHKTPTKLMDGVSTVAGDYDTLYLCKTNGDLLRYDGQIYDETTGATGDPAPIKVFDGVVGIYGEGSTYFAVKADGSLWGYGSDLEHLLMGKAGGKWANDKFIHLMDGVKLPYTAQPVQPSVPVEAIIEPFTDVKVSAYYAEPIKWAVNHGVTVGTSATTFSPDATCTNAQILTFIWRAAGSPTPSLANPFTNLSGDEYYAKAAVWAYSMGMVSGTAFDVDKPCTRAMTMEYLWKQAGSPAMAASGKFTDVSPSAAYATAVAWAVDNGITVGTSGTTFSPDSICTRGQIMTFLYRAETRESL